MKKYVLSIIFGLFGLNGLALEVVNDFDVAVEIGRKAEKNVLVIFTLEDCHYCNVLKNDMTSFVNIDNYVVCILDSREHKRVTGKMKVKRWPTSIVISVSKEGYGETARLVGYSNKSEYDKWLKLNAEFFGSDDACGCDCDDNCSCRKNGICPCCKDDCNCGKDCECKKNGKCSCKNGKCKCKK
jgi:hypothetical protein